MVLYLDSGWIKLDPGFDGFREKVLGHRNLQRAGTESKEADRSGGEGGPTSLGGEECDGREQCYPRNKLAVVHQTCGGRTQPSQS